MARAQHAHHTPLAGAPLAIGWAIGIAGFVVTVMFVGLILWTTPRA